MKRRPKARSYSANFKCIVTAVSELIGWGFQTRRGQRKRYLINIRVSTTKDPGIVYDSKLAFRIHIEGVYKYQDFLSEPSGFLGIPVLLEYYTSL